MKLTFPRVLFGSLIVSALIAPAAMGATTLKIAFMDPLSGSFGSSGQAGMKHFQAVADDINKRNLTGGPKLEIVPFDNKLSPKESLNVLKKVIDQGIRIVVQGQGSSVAGVLIDAIDKHNARNPDKSVLFVNYAAVDPAFTNSKCSFWHFRFDANADMKMEALTDYMAKDQKIKSVYLINQNYSFGQAVASAAKEYLARKRPDIKIVGEDLHPIMRVKDFSPYVAKIKASNADVVITGNWSNDMTLLIKAAKDAGLDTPFYTYYGGGLGALAAMGDAGEGKVKQITEWHANIHPNKTEKYANAWNKKYGGPPDNMTFYFLRTNISMYMLAKAIKEAKSTDPKKIAYKLEGMKYEGDAGEVEMRATDHQLIQPLYISTVAAAYRDPKNPETAKFNGKDPEVKYAQDGTGYGFKTDARIEGYVTAQPTSCQMKRP